jgi:hypothetical protein
MIEATELKSIATFKGMPSLPNFIKSISLKVLNGHGQTDRMVISKNSLSSVSKVG